MNLKDVACTVPIKRSFLYHFTFLNTVATGMALSLFFQHVWGQSERGESNLWNSVLDYKPNLMPPCEHGHPTQVNVVVSLRVWCQICTKLEGSHFCFQHVNKVLNKKERLVLMMKTLPKWKNTTHCTMKELMLVTFIFILHIIPTTASIKAGDSS